MKLDRNENERWTEMGDKQMFVWNERVAHQRQQLHGIIYTKQMFTAQLGIENGRERELTCTENIIKIQITFRHVLSGVEEEYRQISIWCV